MCIFFNFLHDTFFKIVFINMSHGVMVSLHAAGIRQPRIQVHCVPIKTGSDHFIDTVRQVDDINVNIVSHLD